MNRYCFTKGKLYKLKKDTMFFNTNNETLYLKTGGLVVYLNDENKTNYYHKYHIFYSIEKNGIYSTSWRGNVIKV